MSVPEMGYTTEDEPYPRGEIYVRPRRGESRQGYYKNASATDEVFLDGGWYRSFVRG